MFLNSEINQKFYSNMAPVCLFKVLNKQYIQDFFCKYGEKIIGIKQVADKFLVANKSLMHDYSEELLQKYQENINLQNSYRFTHKDLVEIYEAFEIMIRNDSYCVLSINFINGKTLYYVFDGLQVKWVDANDYINLFNLENEAKMFLKKYMEEK